MALNIKNEEAHRLATEIAAMTGTSLTEAVTEALREKKDRLTVNERRDRIYQIVEEMRELIGPEGLPDVNELLYDSQTGLPK